MMKTTNNLKKVLPSDGEILDKQRMKKSTAEVRHFVLKMWSLISAALVLKSKWTSKINCFD